MSIDKFAKRGSKLLSQEELEAHIAALIRLENVGVLLGAGASKVVNGKTMAEVWAFFSETYTSSFQWLTKNKFVSSSASDINLESLLDSLEIAEIEWRRQERKKPLKELIAAKRDVYKSIIRASLLHESWWEHPESVDLEDERLNVHRALLQSLCASRQVGQASPWVFTTNYDLAVEWAAETLGLKINNGFEGLHNRLFSPHVFDLGYTNIMAKGEARFGTYGLFLAKLHGSLSWKNAGDKYLEYPSAVIWQDIKLFLEEKKPGNEPPIILPSAAKYMQTVGFVLGELLRRFTDFLSKAQTCLITIGYSFSDSHLNQIIQRALQNPTLQLVIFLPEVDFSKAKQDNGNTWINRLLTLESPQVTIVGNGDKAYFESLINYLPQPAIYDEHANKIRKLLGEMRKESQDEHKENAL